MPGCMVLRKGTLTGMGWIAECEVLGRLRTPFVMGDYVDALVLDPAQGLPDGEYHISFDGFEMLCFKRHDIWSMAPTYRCSGEAAEQLAEDQQQTELVVFLPPQLPTTGAEDRVASRRAGFPS